MAVVIARRAPWVAAFALVAAQIVYPLTEGAARDRVTVAVVLFSAATALLHAAFTRGVVFAAGLLVIVSGIGLCAEAVGTATGHPFGCYDYALDRLGPATASVPLVVPLAWTGGLYPVWIVAGVLTTRAAPRVALTAVGAVGWDLFLDPQMVADGQWRWCVVDAGLPGLAHIPVTNYLGWLLVGAIMASALHLWSRRYPPHPGADPWVPVAVFLWTWLGSALAHAVFLDLPSSALYGAVGMGILGVPLLWRVARAGPLTGAGRTEAARRIALCPSRGDSETGPGTM